MFIIALSWQFFSAHYMYIYINFYTGRARVYQKMYKTRAARAPRALLLCEREGERKSISLHSLLIVDIFSGMMDHSKDDTRYFL
jgi:hypothetical protein